MPRGKRVVCRAERETLVCHVYCMLLPLRRPAAKLHSEHTAEVERGRLFKLPTGLRRDAALGTALAGEAWSLRAASWIEREHAVGET
jgi:hypothetical protein